MSRASDRVVEREYGIALRAKATPALRALLATAAQAEEELASFDRLGTMLREIDFTGARARLAVHRSWTAGARRSRREDSLLPVVLRLKQVRRPKTAPSDATTVARQRNERRRRCAALSASFASYAVDIVDALSVDDRFPDSRPFASWLNQSVYSVTPVHRLAAIADDRTIKEIDLPGSLQFHTTDAPLARAPFVQRFDRWLGPATGRNARVGIVDGEVGDHPLIVGRVSRGSQYTLEDWGKPQRHATMLAGLIAADGDDYSGSAPGASIRNYKVVATIGPLSAPERAAAEAIQQALLDGMDVINCSFGVKSASGEDRRIGVMLEDVVREGVVVIKSAGNDGPAAKTISAPADAAGVIVVGSCDIAGTQVAPYSARGPTPAGNPAPLVLAPGGIPAAPLLGLDPIASRFQRKMGTSYSAALVSGLAACLVQSNPALQPSDVLRELVSRSVAMCQAPGAVLIRGATPGT